MNDYPKLFNEVIPEAGAVLHLDTALDYPDVKLGNKHWKLDGSCVLVHSQWILTVRHAIDKSRKGAAFIPYAGIFAIADDPIVEDYEYGDTMCLCKLKDKVQNIAPLHAKHLHKKGLESACLAGYGRWGARDGWGTDGIQRAIEVKLHLPGSRRSIRYGDNLDIAWWSGWNQGLSAERNNSGGPMIHVNPKCRALVGVNREMERGEQAASRIGGDRKAWLDDHVGVNPVATGAAPLELRPVSNFGVDRKGSTQQIKVPDGAKRMRATLSATPGLRLQMGIHPGSANGSWLPELATEDRSSGRFLVREFEIPKGVSNITVGVIPVAQAPVEKDQVQAQLCCMFT